MIVVVALKLFVYSIRVVLHFIGIYESCIYSVNDLLVSHYIPIFQGFCSRGQLRVAGGGEFRSVNENNKFVVSYLFIYLAAFFFFFFFLAPSSAASSAGASAGASSAGGGASSFFSSPPPATKSPITSLEAIQPSSSTSNSPKISSTSALLNLSPKFMRARRNISDSILPSTSYALKARTMRSSGSLEPPAIFSWNILTMLSKLHPPPTSPNMPSSSPSSINLPTLSKAARRSGLLRVPSLSTSISLKHSLYITICSWEKPPLSPLPMTAV